MPTKRQLHTQRQERRRANLITLMDDNHCWPTYSERPSPKFEDYDDSYAELAGMYLGVTWDGDSRLDAVERQDEPDELTPKWAASIYDETYTMIELFESLTEALAYSNGQDGEYLTGGGSVVDLDTRKAVEKRTVVVTAPAYAALRRLVQSSELPKAHAEELHAAFPIGGSA